MTYNPNQPRDKDGEWTDDGGSKSTTSVKSEGTHARGRHQDMKAALIKSYAPIMEKIHKENKEEIKAGARKGALIGALAGTFVVPGVGTLVGAVVGHSVGRGKAYKRVSEREGKGFKQHFARPK